ncbi:uncharacterized protein LY89DRAFT_716937 [Mollisia scopiformis]|uniref:Zn(2)-C6 fungal-type domain-containing protein n=1 Tax=Mollisia scopiformis TaxID=149040 RepID=A0A194XI37_MOLSC|nr:uncharacterized protein LY89DRAFT_716937 [Mollisia scopiformis]KUJ19427.1 hypothetical protein LY89DRAFT_716937 [Mollisia scopiformis]
MHHQRPVPKRTRKIHAPKVRTGCITCKIRRVKCDETKPACLRCIKWGGDCDGYASKPSQPPPDAIKKRLILPAAITEPLCRSPANSPFTNDLEYQAFQEFSQHTAKHLTGFRDSDIWSKVVLQASETDSCIRHAVTAIGALNFKDWVRKDNEKARLEFAYREYDRAIVGLRNAGPQADIRTKLISCILFACFESYHGNSETATAQVFAGIELMEQYSRQRLRPPSTTTEYVQQRGGPNSKSMPPLDKEIVETFMLFEIQSSSYSDGRTTDKHRERMKRFGNTVQKIPKEFTTLKQASSMLSRILLWGIHVRFTQDGTDFTPPSAASSEQLPPLLGLRRCTTVYAELAKAMNKYKQWESAFEPLRTKARRAPGSKLFNGVALLQLHCLSSYIWLAAGSPSRAMYYRKYTRYLREIVDLAKILNAQQTEGSFSLDFRTVLPLMIVSANYRHIAIRREVIEIFSSRPRREGLWDSALLGRIMGWVADIEEESVDLRGEEYVPEERVAEIVDIKQDAGTRSAFVTCRQGPEDGEGIMHETTLYW